MKRRKFIYQTLNGLPGIIWLPPLLSSCSILTSCSTDEEVPQIETDKKIIIIGAGMAGLAAARYFKDRNIEVVVLEARDKTGGRIRTDRSLDLPFDEGASWIHGPEGNPLTTLAENSGANTFRTDDENINIYDLDGTLYPDEVTEEAEEAFTDILENLGGSKDLSFGEVFFHAYPQYENNRLWKYMLSAYLEFDTGGDISELSSLDYYDDEAFPGADVIVTNGYDTLTAYLAEGIDVRLQHKVLEIDYSNEKTRITTDQGEMEADFVLVTVPLGVLKAGDFSFTPPLPSSLRTAIQDLNMGSVNKFLCVWEDAFWDTDLQYIGFTPEEKGKFNYFLNLTKFTSVNALMTFTFGNYSREVESMTDEAVKNAIMDHLRTIYGNQIPSPTHLLRTKWNSDPFSFGSYSFATNGSRSSAFEVFEQAVNDQLFFAGEHTSRDYRGTVHGAYLSGERAAKKIIDLLP